MKTSIIVRLAVFAVAVFLWLSPGAGAADEDASGKPTVVPLHEYMKILREYYGSRNVRLAPEKKVKTSRPEGRDLSAWERDLNTTGRFQAVDVFGGKAVLILDTRLGHLWIWALPSVIYAGRVFPGDEPGQEILSIPAP